MNLLAVIAGTLKDLVHNTLMILYSSHADRTYLALARRADRYIEFVPMDETPIKIRTAHVSRQLGLAPHGQKTLETY
jgi:hypothetical protein